MTTQTGFVRVASIHEVEEGAPKCLTVQEKALALFHINGTYYVTDNACPHAGGPLCEGEMHDGVVTCPWHGSKFNVETGEVVQGPAKVAVKSYPVELRGEDIYVSLDQIEDSSKLKAVSLAFDPKLDPERPFSYKEFVDELLEKLKFPFKLYGILPSVIISQSPDEMDFYMGEIHATEVDLQKISEIMKSMNEKWKTNITFCLFLTTQFPGVFLLNVRGPKAPMNMENTIKY